MVISSQATLEAFISRAKHSEVLAIDTEFLREKTYYAKLCLIQMATDTEIVLIDPIAIRDLGVLQELLTDESIIKIFHAATQDLEILYHEVGVLPRPIFDTQIAAALLGHTLQIGYGALVSHICHVSLKKADSFTDWSRRPLSESQLVYAAKDVEYLPQIYRIMRERLEEKGRLAWLTPEFEELLKSEKYEENPRERYKRLKRGNSLKPQQLSGAREVSAWRETFAMQHDIPRKWVLTDEQIVEACRRMPNTLDDLFLIRGLKEKLSVKDAREVLHVMHIGFNLPEHEWPREPKSPKNQHNVDAEVCALQAIVQYISKQNDIAPQTLVSSKELSALARGERRLEVLSGWRRQVIGEPLLRFLSGDIPITCVDGTFTFEY